MLTDYDAAGYARRFASARILVPDARHAWAAALRRAVGGRAQPTVLDLGAGGGRFVPVVRDAWQATRVVAVDRSPAMLRQLDPISYVARIGADMSALPFAAQSFDACFCSMVLHYSRDPRAVCRDIRRTLRPGGMLCVRTGTQETIRSFGFLRYFRQALAAERNAMPRRDDVVGWLRDAGFTDVAVELVRIVPPGGRWAYLRKVLSRGFPSMQLVSTSAFVVGAVWLTLCTAVMAMLRRPIPPEQTLLITAVTA